MKYTHTVTNRQRKRERERERWADFVTELCHTNSCSNLRLVHMCQHVATLCGPSLNKPHFHCTDIAILSVTVFTQYI